MGRGQQRMTYSECGLAPFDLLRPPLVNRMQSSMARSSQSAFCMGTAGMIWWCWACLHPATSAAAFAGLAMFVGSRRACSCALACSERVGSNWWCPVLCSLVRVFLSVRQGVATRSSQSGSGMGTAGVSLWCWACLHPATWAVAFVGLAMFYGSRSVCL